MKKIVNILIILMIVFIISASLQSGQSSGGLSLKIVNLLAFINPFNDVETFHLFIRKMANFSEYALYGTLLALAFRIKSMNKYLNIVLIFLPFVDEFVQTFVPGRDGNLIVVGIDLSGIGFGVFMIFLIYKTNIDKKMVCNK